MPASGQIADARSARSAAPSWRPFSVSEAGPCPVWRNRAERGQHQCRSAVAGALMQMCSSPCSMGLGRIWPAVSRVGQLDDKAVLAGLDAFRQLGAELAIVQALI